MVRIICEDCHASEEAQTAWVSARLIRTLLRTGWYLGEGLRAIDLCPKCVEALRKIEKQKNNERKGRP